MRAAPTSVAAAYWRIAQGLFGWLATAAALRFAESRADHSNDALRRAKIRRKISPAPASRLHLYSAKTSLEAIKFTKIGHRRIRV